MEPGFLDKGYDELVQTFDTAWKNNIHGQKQTYLLVNDKQDIYQDPAFRDFQQKELVSNFNVEHTMTFRSQVISALFGYQEWKIP